jgi:hypothetical protein
MHMFLIYLPIYFCLTCFGLSFSPSSEASVKLRQCFKSAGYGFSAWALTPYPLPSKALKSTELNTSKPKYMIYPALQTLFEILFFFG